MKDILTAPFIREICDTAANMYRLGWDERNCGNISLRLEATALEEYFDLTKVLRCLPLGFAAPTLAGAYFLVTGTGKYFKNMAKDPENELGILRISADGEQAELIWGYRDGGTFTSELAAHLMSHISCMERQPESRVITHCHPTYLLAMNHVHPLDEAAFTHTLWQMCTECIMVFPDGVGVLPWMCCGTNTIGEATAEKMRAFRLVVWGLHGIYASGRTLDEAFGLIETVEKAAQIYMLTAEHTRVNTISDAQLRELAEFLKLDYRKDFLTD